MGKNYLSGPVTWNYDSLVLYFLLLSNLPEPIR